MEGWTCVARAIAASSSGLPDRPPHALSLTTHEKPIIAASERELREMIRSRMYMRAAQQALSYRQLLQRTLLGMHPFPQGKTKSPGLGRGFWVYAGW